MNNPGLTGLQSLQQHGVAIPGETKNIAYFFNLAKKMSDGQLADVLAGKSLNVPQFVAMTEAMGRKQLRQAVDGAQAQQQAQQPTVKDQLLAEERSQGIAGLPAPNMESMDMASGGIVAFDKGGRVPTWEDVQESLDKYKAAQTPWYLPTPKVNPSDAYAQEYQNILNAYQNKKPYEGLAALTDTSDKKDTVAPAAPAAPVSDKKDDKAPAASAAQPPAPPAKKDRMAMPESPDYLAPLTGVGERIRGGIADIKKAKESDALLGISKALLGNATLAKAGAEASGTLMDLGAKTRKEVQAAESAADAYDYNMAKAREAAAQGNKELALKYQQLADLNAYHMGSLGIQSQKLGLLQSQYNDIKIPTQLGRIYADAEKEVKNLYNGIVPASKRAEYTKAVEDLYRKRAAATGLGKYVDTYSPSMGAYNVVQSPRKGANVLELDES